MQLQIDVICFKDGIDPYPWKDDLNEEISELPKEAFVGLFMKMHAVKRVEQGREEGQAR